MSAGAPTTSTLATLRQARAHGEAVVRWLRPIGPLAFFLATWTAFQVRPAPGATGSGLEVSVALGGFVLGGLGLMIASRGGPNARGGAGYLGWIALLYCGSGALVWLQPDGASVVGLVFGTFYLVPRVPGRVAVPMLALTSLFLPVSTVWTHGSTTAAVFNALLIGTAFGLTLLAARLVDANERAAGLLVEAERTRSAQARAMGLAERQRLAREMHDVLAHALSGLMLQLEGTRMLAAEDPSDPRLPMVIERAHHLGKAGLEEAGRAIGTLRGDELPGPERLAELAGRFQADRGGPCQFAVVGDPRELDSEARVTLYRVAQEALTSVTKHAHPERVEVRLA
ncbi:MAG: sensor histidine kinase [Solirubrobacteraceae bacterium]